VDKAARSVYVGDWWKGEIFMFDLDGNLLREFGGRGGGPGQLRNPADIVIHGDTLVVLNTGNSRFELFDLQGNFRGVWPFGANRMPIAFAFAGKGNLVYVDLYSGGLVAVGPQGSVLAGLGQLRSFGQSRPEGISFRCVASDGVGDILALRPTLDIEAVKLTAGASGGARPPTTP
jgi:DNA-binding beta-propeller fold protein YncE